MKVQIKFPSPPETFIGAMLCKLTETQLRDMAKSAGTPCKKYKRETAFALAEMMAARGAQATVTIQAPNK